MSLWTLFAAKEAAYKVVVKIGEAPGFAHRRFEVRPDSAAVRYGDRELILDVDADAERVHVHRYVRRRPRQRRGHRDTSGSPPERGRAASAVRRRRRADPVRPG